jgi:dolichol kinase
VPVNICLNVVWCGGLLLAIAWLIFVWIIGLSTTSLFILGAATGLVFAPIFPLSFGFFNQKLDVVPMLIALLLCGSALGALIFQKVAGKRNLKDEKIRNTFFLKVLSWIVIQIIFRHF